MRTIGHGIIFLRDKLMQYRVSGVGQGRKKKNRHRNEEHSSSDSRGAYEFFLESDFT